MTWHRHLFERIACLFRDNTYFLATQAPFSSVLLPFPHRLHLIRPLLKQLTRKNNFDLAQQLKQFRVEPTEKEVEVCSEAIASKSIDGIKFDNQTEYLVRDPATGVLDLRREFGDGTQVYGVVLFEGVAGRQVRQMSSNYGKIFELFLKFFGVVCLFKVCKVLEWGTRAENFHLLEKSRKR